MKLGYFLASHTKINLKWIKELNVRPDPTKLQEENIGRKFFDINCSNIFFEPISRSNGRRKKKWNLIKLKSFCTAKGTINKMKILPTEWDKTFANNLTQRD